jgi:adenylosuccinate lyase
MIAPDATATLAFMLDRAAGLVEGLVVYPERMRKNLEASGGLFFSEGVMLALVAMGLPRQGAYEIVQRNAMRAFHGEGDFRKLLGEDQDVMQRLTPAELDRCFDLQHALRWADQMIGRAIAS